MKDIEDYLSEITSDPSVMIVMSFLLIIFVIFFVLKKWLHIISTITIVGIGTFIWLWYFDPYGTWTEHFINIYLYLKETFLNIYDHYL